MATAFNIKQLYVTKKGRLDLLMFKGSIFIKLYTPIATKQLPDGKEVPLFRKYENGKVIENALLVKINEYELGTLIMLMRKFINFNFNPEKLHKFCKIAGINSDYKIQDNAAVTTVSFFHKSEKGSTIWSVGFSNKGITIYAKRDTAHRINIMLAHIETIISALDFALKEFFEKFKFSEETVKNGNGAASNQINNNQPAKQQQQKIEEPINIESDDEEEAILDDTDESEFDLD